MKSLTPHCRISRQCLCICSPSTRPCSGLPFCPARTHLEQQFSQHDKEPHQLPRIGSEYPLGLVTAQILGGSLHGRRNDIPRRVHEQLGKPFKYFLNLLRVRFLQILHAEVYANVTDAARYLAIGLPIKVSMLCRSPLVDAGRGGSDCYQCHKGVFRLIFAGARLAGWLLRAARHAHAPTVGHVVVVILPFAIFSLVVFRFW